MADQPRKTWGPPISNCKSVPETDISCPPRNPPPRLDAPPHPHPQPSGLWRLSERDPQNPRLARGLGSPPPPSMPKRRRGVAASPRCRKKQKRLDAICDVAPTPPPGGGGGEDSDPESVRRSTRARRAPVTLDTSPAPSPRRMRPRRGGGVAGSSGSPRRGGKGRARGQAVARVVDGEEDEEDGGGNAAWRSRLRDRAKGKAGAGRRVRTLWVEDEDEDEEEGAKEEGGEESGGLSSRGMEVTEGEINLTIDVSVETHDAAEGVTVVEEEDEEKGVGEEDDEYEEEEEATGAGTDLDEGNMEEVGDEDSLQEEEKTKELDSPVLEGENGDENADEVEFGDLGENEQLDVHHGQIAEASNLPDEQQMELDGHGPDEQVEEVQQDGQMDDAPNIVLSEDALNERVGKSLVSDEKRGVVDVKEGRRCGLCGGGTDGRPPKIALHDTADSENEAYEGAMPSEEPNYDIWDGFSDDPGWLGRLLGPIHDRFGIARVWVHQNCAVWSPEVYFAGLGCLKNVRAALCRGRLLKCSRCGRPGATIGCRVDRCPKTYHLPCSRTEACIFDHRKFLITCNDHRHLFQPQGDKYAELLRKMKIKKMKANIRKLSHDAWRKDIEAEEKWLENCGEDEEFLKREGKRLNRDLLRIAPVYIGGSSENDEAYRGWESVAGLSDVIQSMKEVVILPLLYPEFFSSLGLTPPRGVLLHGHPGTGKTLVVRALIGACSQGNRRIAYFARKGADCLGKYVGDAERQLRLLFQVAEKCQPSIIFFDEMDGLAPCRSRQQDQTHNSVVATLLSLLDGLKSRGSVIVIGATNRPDAIDPALRRPGRFDREIYFPLPTLEARSAILSLHTKNWPSPISGTFLSAVASQTIGYAGADLQAICTQAALNALKRTCPLQDILRFAEKGTEHGRLPLPSIDVEERDWLSALAAAPPPCSQREAGIAANDLVSAPIDSYLLPCLLKPLLHLLISLCLDERIWLPLSLLTASSSIKEVVFSSMEKNNVPHTFWCSYLPVLIQQKDIGDKIVSILSSYGLTASQLGNHGSMLLSQNKQHEKFDDRRLSSTCSLNKGGLAYKLTGFRALVAGAPGSGQQHLVRCLLHGFVGQTVIHKLDLATMAQEGNGDILNGLTQILLKGLHLERCIIYMPRVDLWAVNTVHEQETEDHGRNMGTSKLASSPVESMPKCSEVWNTLVDQMSSLSASVSISVLATSELKFQDLPCGVKHFFSTHVVDQCLSSSEHTVPRFSVNVDSSISWDEVLDSCALRLSHDLIQHHVQLLHDRAHNNRDEQKEVFAPMEISAPDESKSCENQESTILAKSSLYVEERPSYPTKLPTCNAQPHPSASDVKDKEEDPEKLVSRNPSSRTMKGNESLSIIAFGIQILQHPQFSKLCWVTSKLREGPCTDINGPWKGWPFNSCLLHGSSSSDKSLSEGQSVVKGKEKFLCVRGLVAVGLLAYRGVYASVMEVCAEVRKVLELLVEQIRIKILEKKSRYRYFHILSQVAYLDDIVNSWAYTFQRLHPDSRTRALGTKPASLGKSCTRECESTSYATESNVLSGPVGGSTEVQDTSAQQSHDHLVGHASCPSEMHDKPVQQGPDQLKIHSVACNIGNDHLTSIPRIDAVEHDLVCSASPDAHKGTLAPADSVINDGGSGGVNNGWKMSRVTNGKEKCKPDIQRSESLSESVEDFNNMQRAENSSACPATTGNVEVSKKTMSSESHGSGNELNTGFPLNDVQSDHSINGHMQDSIKNFSVPKSSCLYECCSACFCAVYKLSRDILSNSVRLNKHCLTIDDMHDILSSCSLNLLVTVRKWHSSQGVGGCQEEIGKRHYLEIISEHCVCQGDVSFVSMDCTCHLESSAEAEASNKERHSLCGQSLSFFFKDGVLMPQDLTAGTTLHCNFKRLCVCSLPGTISMLVQIPS
ncbi:uncharacterized protein LOC123441817 [Hordeum vulgare subsp. vulgare]|nr:uncharacterized protein LOC123441817 [Hordeum vulgare subsp. vulgare]